MKKLSILLVLLLLLVACGDTEQSAKKEDQVSKETKAETTETTEGETKEVVDEPTESALTNENIQEIIEYAGTGEGDELISAAIEGKELKAEIKLAPDDMFSADLLAVTRYSQVSDELLNYEGWETLTVEYSEVGTISMNRLEAETNEMGMSYFPTEIIESRLK